MKKYLLHSRVLLLTLVVPILSSFPIQDVFSSGMVSQEEKTSLYEKGLHYLDTGKLKEAEEQFKLMLKENRKSVKAYIGLGRVYDTEKPGSRKAEYALKQAIRFDSKNPKAYYYIGLVLLHTEIRLLDAINNLKLAIRYDPLFIDAWIELAYASDQWTSSDMVKILARALEANPGNSDLFVLFIDAITWYSTNRKGLKVLEDLIDKNPGKPHYALQLPLVYFALGKTERSLAALDSLKSAGIRFSDCQDHLLRSRIYFVLGDEEKGMQHYWASIQAISDSLDAKAVFQHARYIMDDEEYSIFVKTPVSQQSDFYDGFWRSRDPNLATPFNERIPEHFRRLQYANSNYRRFNIGKTASDLTHKLYHQLRSLSVRLQFGNDFMKSHLSGAIPEKRPFDDMGLIYIRHGEPNNVVFSLENTMLPQNMTWQYYPRYNRPEMVFHFSRSGGSRGWIIESMPITTDNRDVIHPLYERLDRALEIGEELNASAIASELTRKNTSHASTGLRTETTAYRFDKKPLDFPFAVLGFKGGNDMTLLDLYFGLEGKLIELDTVQVRPEIRIEKFIGFYNDQFQELVRLQKENRIPMDIPAHDWEQSSAVDMEQIELIPGPYTVEIHLHDLTSDKLGVYKGVYQVENFNQHNLMLSDILVSGLMEQTTIVSQFRRGDYLIRPHMFSAFPGGSVIGLYFEVYNLTFNEEGRTQFGAATTLQPYGTERESQDADLKRMAKESVTTSYEFSGQERDEKNQLNIDIGRRKPGRYEIVIQIHDEVSGEKAKKIVPITVQ
ncbi:GWxTD domain-containing protein [bacterium]